MSLVEKDYAKNRIKGVPIIKNPEERRRNLRRAVDEFLKSGGVIQKLGHDEFGVQVPKANKQQRARGWS